MKETPEDRPGGVGVYDNNGASEPAPEPASARAEAEPPPRELPGRALPSTRQLPPGGNKIERIAQHGKGLFEDLTSWIELRLKLAQLEIEERIDAKLVELQNKFATAAIIGVLAALGGLFALIALSLFFAAVLIALELDPHWSYFLGFLITTVILLGLAGAVRAARPEFFHKQEHRITMDEEKLAHPAPPSRPAPPPPSAPPSRSAPPTREEPAEERPR